MHWAVVDQIDAGIAAVELPDRSIVYVGVAALPAGVREGDRVRLSSRINQEAGFARRRRKHEP
jgi:hypothetical protein